MTIFKKNFLTLTAAMLGFTTVIVVSVMIFMNSLYNEINIHSLGNTAKTFMKITGESRLEEIFTNTPADDIKRDYFPLGAEDTYRLTLITVKGDVLWDSHVTDRLVNHIDREEIIEALEGNAGISYRESISTNMRRIYYALPVFSSANEKIGVFRLSISIPGFSARISPIVSSFSIFICFFIIAAAWAIYIFSRSLSSSVCRLVDIVQEGAPLLPNHNSAEPVKPEFKSLEKTMRAMTEELNIRYEQIKSEGGRLQAILNGMSEAVFAMDALFKLHLVNPKARELFNLGNLNIKAMTLLEATHSTELVEIAKNAINSGQPIEKELTFHSGAEQCFQVYASPLERGAVQQEEKNSEAGVVLVMQDITRLVRLERIRKDFVANVSHELRTPIQLVKGFSETLLDTITENSGQPSDYKHFIEIIYKNAGIMENLTNDLLMLASLENNDGKVYDMKECSAASLIREAVSSAEHLSKKKKIEIIVNCPDDLILKLYGSLIIQGLINLIDNGIKYSPDNSKLWVSAYLTEVLQTSVAGNSAAESTAVTSVRELVFEVRDKGIGIPAEHLGRIFERFYRVDRARSREEGGTGLGLSIVRHIALFHNGKAEAESHAGEGSTFRIRIPVPLQN